MSKVRVYHSIEVNDGDGRLRRITADRMEVDEDDRLTLYLRHDELGWVAVASFGRYEWNSAYLSPEEGSA